MSTPPTSAFGTPLLIANPAAGRRGSPVLRELVAGFRTLGVEPDVVITDGRGSAGRLARDAARAGRRLLVAVGGDGTVHELVNGVFDPASGEPVDGIDRAPVVGVVSAGSGSDLVRTFGLDLRADVLAEHLCSEHTLAIDLMQLTVRDAHGAPHTRLGINVAEAGYGGAVVRRSAQLPRRLGPARYPAAIVAAAPSFRRVPTTITHDGQTIDEPVCNVVVANGQFFGGGLRVAPRALPTDGVVDVQSWGGRPIDVIRGQPQLRRGTHLAREDVRSWRAAHVVVDASRPLVVEADGEVLGTTPLEVRVLPGALRLKL